MVGEWQLEVRLNFLGHLKWHESSTFRQMNLTLDKHFAVQAFRYWSCVAVLPDANQGLIL